MTEKAQERTWVEETVFKDNDARRAQAASRIAMWSFHALLLSALGLLLWRACGWVWAAGTLTFLALEPTVGAFLPVVMTDLPLALTLMIAVVTAGMLAATWEWRWVVGCGVAVGLGIHRHRADPMVGGGAGDADSDLTAVGDEDLRDRHGAETIAQRKPVAQR